MSPPPSPAESPLPFEERRRLLHLARHAISDAVLRDVRPQSAPVPKELAWRCGVFVTLWEEGRLRGCVGKPESPDPLEPTVARCAVLAALEDPRFPALCAAELDVIEIEISLLSPLRMARPEEVEAGRHGVSLSRGAFRGLLLPQVALEFGWSSEKLLSETCRKAGLEPSAWKDPETRLFLFTAEVFSEAEIRSVSGGEIP
jgi:AmmeMemoRadiSam system protein A